MALMVKETHIKNWGTEPLRETFCPSCGSSIIEHQQAWPLGCWYCHKEMPRMYKHFFQRKLARFYYYDREGTV